MNGSLRLKNPAGWFAAGREMNEALELLSDGAFKLYVYVCLHAERGSGRLVFRQADLARRLSKSPRSITSYLDELRRRGVCVVQSAANQHQPGWIEVADRFWPYRKQRSPAAEAEQARYIDRIRRLFLSRSCVGGGFGAHDEKLAADWHRRGLPLEQIERAYLLGCVRKYAALIRNPAAPPISSLHYFSPLLNELTEMETSSEYWQYLAQTADRLERQWQRVTTASPTAHANFAPPNSAARTRPSSPEGEETR